MKRSESASLRDATRSLVLVLWMTVTMVPWAIMSVVMSIFLRGAKLYWLTTYWVRFAIGGAKWIAGIDYQVLGWKHVQEAINAQSVIVLSKHQSAWETFAFSMIIPRPLSYVFKREILYVPFFGWAMGRMDMIHIDRSNRGLAWTKIAEQGKRYMDEGHWVIMFPEGTRTARGEQGTYKTGGARLSLATNRPILPVALTSGRCWPRQSLLVRPGRIDVSFGPLIWPEGRTPEDITGEVENWIECEMRRLDPEAYDSADRQYTVAASETL